MFGESEIRSLQGLPQQNPMSENLTIRLDCVKTGSVWLHYPVRLKYVNSENLCLFDLLGPVRWLGLRQCRTGPFMQRRAQSASNQLVKPKQPNTQDLYIYISASFFYCQTLGNPQRQPQEGLNAERKWKPYHKICGCKTRGKAKQSVFSSRTLHLREASDKTIRSCLQSSSMLIFIFIYFILSSENMIRRSFQDFYTKFDLHLFFKIYFHNLFPLNIMHLF